MVTSVYTEECCSCDGTGTDPTSSPLDFDDCCHACNGTGVRRYQLATCTRCGGEEDVPVGSTDTVSSCVACVECEATDGE